LSFNLIHFLQFINFLFQGNKSVSLWDNCNRETITVDLYMQGINAMKPAAFVALCDGETPKDCPSKFRFMRMFLKYN